MKGYAKHPINTTFKIEAEYTVDFGAQPMFFIKDVVYLRTDKEQCPRIVTGITIREGSVTYGLSHGAAESWHYGFEITKEENLLTKITG
jgi:hypothetical protein